MNEEQIKYLIGFVVISVLLLLINGVELEDAVLGLWNGAVSLIGLILLIKVSTDTQYPAWRRILHAIGVLAIASLLVVTE